MLSHLSKNTSVPDLLAGGLGQGAALVRLDPVGLGHELHGGQHAMLGGLHVRALVHVVVAAQAAVGAVSHQALGEGVKIESLMPIWPYLIESMQS